MATIVLQSRTDTAHVQESTESAPERFRVAQWLASKWTVLLAAFSITFVAVGVPNSFGVFLDYYETTLFPTKSSSEIIVIGSLASSLYMILGVFTGRLADIIGYQAALLIGSVLIIGGLFAASAASEFYQLVLSQGLTLGLGTAFVYYPAVSVSRQYFLRHGLANGFVLSGGALGGCILPYSTRVLLQRYGMQATFRALGYMSTGMLAFAFLCFLSVETRSSSRRRAGKLLDFELLKDSRFLVMVIAGTVAMTGFLPRYFLITPSAVAKGVDTSYAAWLLGIMNGLSILGRLGIGYFADRYGKLTALVVSYMLCGAGHLAFWLPAVVVKGDDSKPAALMTVFVVFVGLLGSGFVSLTPVVLADIFGAEDLASKVGLLNSIMGLGVLAGPSVVYAIVSGGSDWSMAVLLPGLLMMLGGLMLTRTSKSLW